MLVRNSCYSPPHDSVTLKRWPGAMLLVLQKAQVPSTVNDGTLVSRAYSPTIITQGKQLILHSQSGDRPHVLEDPGCHRGQLIRVEPPGYWQTYVGYYAYLGKMETDSDSGNSFK